jgi:CDP-diacylglycerol--glycerol-3-phosphate 3-phosphatidyltransferase
MGELFLKGIYSEGRGMDKKIFSIPNIISFFRLLLVVPLVTLFSQFNTNYDFRMYALALIGLIALTDKLDGYFARKLNQITELGKILDPVSDKVIICVMGFYLFIYGEISPAYFMLVLIRDIYVFAGSVIITKKIGTVLPSTISGKISVLMTGIFMTWSIIDANKDSWFYIFLLSSSVILIFNSIIAYTIRGLEAYRAGPQIKQVKRFRGLRTKTEPRVKQVK